MQHQYWITKQTLSRKFGRKEDECIVSSDAELDAKLELFRNIQISCSFIQRIIDKYQESICYLSQETNSMGRFLKENSDNRTRAGEMMLAIGKAFIYCAQQQLTFHEPLVRFYRELETFRQRAIGDTLQNVAAMEKARTEYRAALSWMKNISQQLDPDTSKQLEKFKKVQDQVRRGKSSFDKLSLDCLEKIDLLAAARCNMLNYALSFYQNKFLSYTERSAKTYSTISKAYENKYEDEVSRNVHIKPLTSPKLGNNNIYKYLRNENNSVFSENEALLIDNITKENSTSKSFEGLVTGSCSNSNEIKSLDCKQNPTHPNFTWDASKLLPEYEFKEYYDKLQKVFMSDCNNILNEIFVDKTEVEEMSKIDWNTDDGDTFLPTTLLAQRLKNASIVSEIEEENFYKEKENVELANRNYNTRAWFDLFEELDPLSKNTIEKSMKNKNSLV